MIVIRHQWPISDANSQLPAEPRDLKTGNFSNQLQRLISFSTPTCDFRCINFFKSSIIFESSHSEIFISSLYTMRPSPTITWTADELLQALPSDHKHRTSLQSSLNVPALLNSTLSFSVLYPTNYSARSSRGSVEIITVCASSLRVTQTWFNITRIDLHKFKYGFSFLHRSNLEPSSLLVITIRGSTRSTATQQLSRTCFFCS
jgi:hypothetical protein